MKPDLIATYPTNCDYPLWRKFIKDNRSYFNNVIIAFSKGFEGFDYSDFVRVAMSDDDVVFSNPPSYMLMEDWRHESIHRALLFTTSDDFLFMEQDFIVDRKGLNKAKKLFLKADVVGVYEGERLHPCFMLIKSETLRNTNLDFSVKHGIYDHFGRIQKDLISNSAKIEILPSNYYEHLNGLTNNFYLISSGRLPNYNPERFKKYIEDSLNTDIVLNDNYIKVCNNYLNGYCR